MRLSPRLQTIANYVKEGSIVADIGTDHGYVPVYLVENGVAKGAIAADINEGPLKNAQGYIEQKKMNDLIETRLGNGLKPINVGEVDTVIIAGMGGLLIRDILEESKELAKTIKYFILQPMVASDELRKYLYENNYNIIDEKLSKEDHKYYEILLVTHGSDYPEKEIHYEIGKKLIENKDELLKEFIEKKIKKVNEIMENLKGETTQKAQEQYEIMKKRYDDYREVLGKL